MRPELAHLQRLEHYLRGCISAAEAAAWARQLPQDPALAADVALQRHLYQGLRQAGRQQLRAELHAIHHQLYGPPAAGWLPAAVRGLRAVLRRFRR